MEAEIKAFLQHINLIVLILVLLGGLFAKNYMTNIKIAIAFKTLIMGTLFVILWILVQVLSGSFDVKQLPDYFITYCVTTSLYELLLKYAFDKLLKMVGNEK
jgi:hypothetical protein